MARCSILAFAIALALVHSTSANEFSLSGDMRLSQPATVQANARYSLRAGLSTSSSTAGAVAQFDARYSLLGALSATSLVCYNDTIFRDDFDGDGL